MLWSNLRWNHGVITLIIIITGDLNLYVHLFAIVRGELQSSTPASCRKATLARWGCFLEACRHASSSWSSQQWSSQVHTHVPADLWSVPTMTFKYQQLKTSWLLPVAQNWVLQALSLLCNYSSGFTLGEAQDGLCEVRLPYRGSPTDVKRYQSTNYGTDATVDCRLTVVFTLSDKLWNRERERKENRVRRELSLERRKLYLQSRTVGNTKERMEIRGLVVSYCACCPNMQYIFEKMHINNGGKKHKNKVILCVVFACFPSKTNKCDSVF